MARITPVPGKLRTSDLELRPAEGVAHLRAFLSPAEQQALASECLALGAGAAGFYTPVVRGMHPMSVQMLCLGRHWNAVTYRYEQTRSDVDGREAPALPGTFADLARRIADAAGFEMHPDICIVNWYRAGSRMGLHQDKDESPESIARGAPVVSVSLGDTAIFKFGGLKRKDPVETISPHVWRRVRIRRSRPSPVPRRPKDRHRDRPCRSWI